MANPGCAEGASGPVSQPLWKDAGIETIGRFSPWLRETLRQWGAGLKPVSRLAVALDRSERFREELLAKQSVTLRGPDPMGQFLETFFDVCGVDYLGKALHRGLMHGVAPRPQGHVPRAWQAEQAASRWILEEDPARMLRA